MGLLAVGPGCVFVDAGCGGGRYALAAADLAGAQGLVAAFDFDGKYLGELRREAAARGMGRMAVFRADLTRGIALAPGLAHACLAAGVLHMPQVRRALSEVFQEFARILRPGGRLGILQRLLRDAPVGPPSPDACARRRLETAATAHGLALSAARDFGFNQLLVFQKS